MTEQNFRNRPSQRPWQKAWLALLRDFDLPVDPATLRQRINGCRVRRLEISPGQIVAEVVCQTTGPCSITIEAKQLDDTEWNSAFAALSTRRSLSKQLRSGEVPNDIQLAFDAAGMTLLPGSSELLFHCNCPKPQEPICQPALATFVAVGEMLNDDPWLLFRLRGRDRPQVTRALSLPPDNQEAVSNGPARPAEESSLVYRAGGMPAHGLEASLIDDETDHYWGHSRQQHEFQHHVVSPHIELVLLRRLGPPPFADGSFEVYDRLANIYRHITAASLALAYSPLDDPEAETGE